MFPQALCHSGQIDQRTTPGTSQTTGVATTKKKSSGKKTTTYTETTTNDSNDVIELRGTLIHYGN